MENRDKITLLEQRHKFTWKTNLAEAIKAGNKGFDLVRYIHEGRGEKFEFYLGALPDTASIAD